MIVYIPTPITSVEQAERLPDDAIVIGVETGERYTRAYEGDWWGVSEMGTRLAVDLDAGDAVMALVPIEAKEETITVQTRGQAHPDWRTRLTTPWKWIDGPSRDRRGDCA